MGKGKKAFIDRKQAVTFHLVHRSQHDPLITDETAPQHVLLETTFKNQKDDHASNPIEDKEKRKEQQRKFGVYYDDDYNYLQHLKAPSNNTTVWEYVGTPNQQKIKKEKPKLQLPSSVFETDFEEDEGLLNKAAPRPGPRPDWDPDIVAALDDDFDFDDPENVMEDDFIAKAMQGDDDEYDDEYEDEDSDVSSENLGDFTDESDGELENEGMDNLAPLRNNRFIDEEVKSRFTEYSMSSSVIRRNEQLSLLDDRFEKFYETYDDIEIGPLDTEDIDGKLGPRNRLIRQCLRELKRGEKIEDYSKEWDKERVEKYREIHENGSDDEIVEVEVNDKKSKKRWDCESILSTYSNTYNHPKLIEEPRKSRKSQNRESKIEIDSKTGIPMHVLKNDDSQILTAKALSKFDNQNDAENKQEISGSKSLCAKSMLSTLSVLSIRPKDETPEEKRERKRLLKEYRAERRVEKKANAEAFKEEKKKQEQTKINNQNNIQGNRIL
ncbi:protein LTV1 homolog [Condylostylus longicornis]|uniref:protein LTV1 homolog n=1 Tax=Condylostylus longicornis TaxID=2530218 RepID=UPI00244DCAC6|nr:protein LTV1 homolog [Condylostylus longicornis]